MQLFSNRSEKTSKCSKNIGVTLYTTFLFLPHFDIICDQHFALQNRHTAKWTLYTFLILVHVSKDRQIDVDITIVFCLFNIFKKADSMSPCNCSVIDHRRHQNAVKTLVSPCIPLFCSYHILTSSAINTLH